MRILVLSTVAVALAALASPAMADGLITTRSTNSFDTTHGKLLAGLASRGFGLVADVDHAKGAQSVGASLQPTRLLIFGNPRGGTVLMACQQAVGIDLPLKMLITQSADNAVTVSYNDPAWISARHKLGDCGKPALEAMSGALKGLVDDAIRQ